MVFCGLLFGRSSDHSLCVVGHTTVVVNYWYLQPCNKIMRQGPACRGYFFQIMRGLYTLSLTCGTTSTNSQHPLYTESADLLICHSFTHRRRGRPCKATASSSGAVRVRCLAEGQLDTQLGGCGDLTSNLPVISHPTCTSSTSWATVAPICLLLFILNLIPTLMWNISQRTSACKRDATAKQDWPLLIFLSLSWPI